MTPSMTPDAPTVEPDTEPGIAPDIEPDTAPGRRTNPFQPDPAPLKTPGPDRETCPDEGPCPFKNEVGTQFLSVEGCCDLAGLAFGARAPGRSA